MNPTDTFNDRVETFERIMGDCVTKEFVDWLIENGFFDAPASTKYHGNFEGGLFYHSYWVAKELVEMTDNLNLSWMRAESPFIIGMFHDLCKIDAYEVEGMAEGEVIYTYNKNQMLKGHGEKSIMLLSQFMTLTEEEILCIRYHMGAYETENWNEYGRAIEKYPNVLWTHTADMVASKVMGV